MATLVLGAVGTLIGGPVGGALGALVGRSVDGVLAGGGQREGPRLRDLAITTSSYGQPLPRHHGRMRVSGSVIWATDLVENRETSGGGKGKPKTTTYSYSSSFAVALASRPIEGVGRIWADGNLLRGAAGDLKSGGTLRIYRGHGDQRPDPLIAAAEGSACPAFRNCAYVVFEDLELADFGNRIPALSFEVLADVDDFDLRDLIEPLIPVATTRVPLGDLDGFSYEGGDLRAGLETIGALFPLACDCGGDGLTIAPEAAPDHPVITLPPPVVAWQEEDFGRQDGALRERDGTPPAGPDALRYYDVARDFQPGLQRSEGSAVHAASRTLEFPGALHPDAARALVGAAGRRAHWLRERLAWRVAELDPAVAPGSLVRVSDVDGLWRVASWEWRENGIELDLVRHAFGAVHAPPGEAGTPGLPVDTAPSPTLLRAFELPWDGTGDPATPAVFAVASAAGAHWRGAALYIDRQGALEPLGTTGRTRSIMGALAAPLPPSPALVLERQAVLTLDLVAEDLTLASADAEAIAAGANRLLVGSEIVQFMRAMREGDRRWRLEGLVRGRGGTEAAAQAGHGSGTLVTLLDASLVPLVLDRPNGATIAAIGAAEDEPVAAQIESAGVTRRPLAPVHPRATVLPSGALSLRWIRRARGGWTWPAEIELPLVEEAELYRVGIGPVEAPLASWEVAEPRLVIEADDLAALSAAHPGAAVWVRQIGSFAASDPLYLNTLA
ncbi:phage tail protein [Pelagerythrobacter rhizovicinus]|uniref:Uncharacterized protein n=1 Tax=Pelagerythrobacter rhizovicinus TaxID=2268576 RepID=A0A4V1QW45_9SPHN|nr:phage tail protein [Pelagerythrobacter rhizovicinus]RXZ64876.1 hypothetical protein ETX26_13585 [Pelagerythrobacter rhizovicinus]